MCLSCDPGLGQLSSLLLRNIDASALAQSNASTPFIETTVNDGTTIFNGSIITMMGGTYSQVDALVIKGDTILYTGTKEGARAVAGPEVESIDLNGQCLLPGFIEPHLHTIMTSLADYPPLLKLSPSAVTTQKKAIKVIEKGIHDKEIMNGWVVGFGYDPSRIEGHLDLTKGVLDNISTEYPIFILNQSGHLAYVNSTALEIAGITDATTDPNYQKSNGKLTGIIFEEAVATVGALIPPLKAETLICHCQSTLRKWASVGCTAIFDAGIGANGTSDMSLLNAATTGDVPVRFYGAISSRILPTNPDLATLFQPPIILGNVQIQAVKYWADGSTQGFTAALNQPYYKPPPNTPTFGTLDFPSENELYQAMLPWYKSGFQQIVHANGDRATQQALNVYEALSQAKNPIPHRGMHRIDHFTVTEPIQLARAKELGLGVSHTIGHVSDWGQVFSDYVLGPARAARIDPLRSDEDANLVWSLHSDSPVTEVNPLKYLKTATTRLMLNGCVLGEEEKVGLEIALKGVTLNAARQLGIEHIAGTLEAGKKADLVLLSKDPRTVPPRELDQLVVEQTWMNGKITWERLEK